MRFTLACVAIACFVLGLLMWLRLTMGYTTIGSDFTQDYLAGLALRNGELIYGNTILESWLNLLGTDGRDNYHPPFLAIVALPFTYLSYPTAVVVWNSINLVLYFAILLIIVRELKIPTPLGYVAALPLFIWYPFISNIGLLQVSIPVVFLILLGWRSLRHGSEVSAGVFFAIATLLKLFPGFFGIYLLATRKWRGAVTMGAVLVIGSLFTYLTVGHANVATYLLKQMPENASIYASSPLNISIPSIVATLFTENRWSTPIVALPGAKTISYAICLAITILIVSIGRKKQESLDNFFCLTCIAMLLVSPITWIHVLPLLLLPIGILASEYKANRNSLRVALLLLILTWLPDVHVARYLHSAFSPELIPWYVLIISKTGFFALALLWLVFLRRVRN